MLCDHAQSLSGPDRKVCSLSLSNQCLCACLCVVRVYLPLILLSLVLSSTRRRALRVCVCVRACVRCSARSYAGSSHVVSVCMCCAVRSANRAIYTGTSKRKYNAERLCLSVCSLPLYHALRQNFAVPRVSDTCRKRPW